jgi:hypothetical protein
MPRKTTAPDGKRVVPPHVIAATAVYSIAQARACLGLTKSTLSREVRLGRLRVGVRAGRRYFLGEWLLEWLRSGEVARAAKDGNDTGAVA